LLSGNTIVFTAVTAQGIAVRVGGVNPDDTLHTRDCPEGTEYSLGRRMVTVEAVLPIFPLRALRDRSNDAIVPDSVFLVNVPTISA